VRFARDAFFAGRSFADRADLNAQADAWCQGMAADRRCPGDHSKTVREALAEERPRLLALPDIPIRFTSASASSPARRPMSDSTLTTIRSHIPTSAGHSCCSPISTTPGASFVASHGR
jgi:hypothetical protein